MHQTVKAFTSTFEELVLRTDITEINNELNKEASDFYTDDSMQSIKRHIYSHEEALRL